MPSASAYHLTEPFPAPARQYAGYGRGGAGNYTRNSRHSVKLPAEPTVKDENLYLVSTSEQPYPPPRGLSQTSKPSRKVHLTGRGGIGNLHPAAERAMFSFDEELERARKAEATLAPVYHIGIGGAGNLIHVPRSESVSTRAGSVSSADSERSIREKIRARFSR